VAYKEALAGRIRAILAARPDVEEKKMFGGLSFMVAGQMCCGVLKDDLVLRVGEERFGDAMAQPHVRPFDLTGRPSMGMVYVASVGLSSDDTLRAWVQRGVDHVKAHPKTSKRASRKR
jgi:TfoX/Sxy family transcriptional regulator of competence genes